ncbi:MAG: hypothetical protein ACREOO_30440 [bacterium]
MTDHKDRLYELLPVIHRQRDAEQGYPLRALLQVIAEQVNVVEEDITQLYENWFIETCQDWVVPYIGDLIGYRIVHEAGEPGEVTTTQGQQRNKILIPRRDVANTIRDRRRKGTLALLEQLANDVAGWPSRAVEFYKLLGWTQHLNHQHPKRGRTVDLRNGQALDLIDGPFDELAHTVDVRRMNSHRSIGRYNIPSVGLFVWRLKAYPVTKAPAYCLEDEGPHYYTFSVLGNDGPLYAKPEPETEPTHIAEELNLPTPIRRRGFEDKVMVNGHVTRTQASDAYYGKSLIIWAPGWPSADAEQPIPREKIIPADLSDWHYRPLRDYLAVDPVLGRIAFPPSQLPKKNVRVSYYYLFSADLGGGEYDRPLLEPAQYELIQVSGAEQFKTALARWKQDDDALFETQPSHAVIEITDSDVYVQPINITLKQNHSLQIRAANRVRPVIRLLDWQTDLPDFMSVTVDRGSRFTLDGLLITGRGVHIQGGQNQNTSNEICAAEITIRHSTLVPGWALHCDCEPKRPAEPSLELYNVQAKVTIAHSIIGSIQVNQDEVTTDPIPIRINDSILDATSSEREALGAPGCPVAHAVLTIARSTVFGQIQTHAIELAENCIFEGLIKVARRQLGCMRFCYVTPGSRTPRRYNCQPDLVDKIVAEQAKKDKLQYDEWKHLQECERLRVRPQFNSMRYGTHTYCQLADTCAEEITRGADDEAELGVFHDLFQPQREVNLRARLDEYTPAGMQAGIIYAS